MGFYHLKSSTMLMTSEGLVFENENHDKYVIVYVCLFNNNAA